ncbi:MAG: DUF2318 domain-containing protein [Ignavibacteriae bacterium]|nr:DUF2318 domain-containing protein [Ignavibacteria bacterium]MBI3365121.1 DUF2318 domain-containing protein [Ignavibacteriota bacterium]
MIESLIIALREGIEIALVIGILIVYLKKVQQTRLIRSVYIGLVLSLLASIGGAIIIQRLSFDQEKLEGYIMLIAVVFVISMIVWMWVTAKKIRLEIEKKVGSIIESQSSWQAHLSLMSFTFLMIVREGIETVIFLQAIAFSTGAWWSMFGTIIGLACATVFALLFIRGSVRIDIGRFLKVTALTLLIFTFQLTINAIHEFYEHGVLPASPKMMGILGPIVQNNILFIIAIVSIPALMLVIPGQRAKQGTATSQGQRRWQLSAGFASLVVILFLGVGDIFSSNQEMNLSSQLLVVPESGVLRISLDQVSDNNLHRYAIHDDSLEIRFFVLRTGLSTFATAFDACYACYSYGKYYLKNGQLICSLCDAPSPLRKLSPAMLEDQPDENNSGSMEGNGCAPIYLPSRIHNGSIEVKLSDLRHQRKYFEISRE